MLLGIFPMPERGYTRYLFSTEEAATAYRHLARLQGFNVDIWLKGRTPTKCSVYLDYAMAEV